MYPKSIVAGVHNGQVRFQQQQPQVQAASVAPRERVITASADYSAASTAVVNAWSSQYQWYFTGLIPAEPNYTDSSQLALFYRDIYLHDSVGGSIVDILSTFGYSKFSLRGIDQKRASVYEQCLDQLDIQRVLPTISTARLVDGFFCGSLVYDPAVKHFTDILFHDALQCSVQAPAFNNVMPQISVVNSPAVTMFLESNSEYAQKYLRSLPAAFVRVLKSGAYNLSPSTTLYVPRRTLTDRPYTSYLHRLLPYYLIEKSLFRGTLVEVGRRQRAMTHLSLGDDTWIPNTAELNAYVAAFREAERDPLGGFIATRNAVQVSDVRTAGDFLKFTDMAEPFVQFKLRALGVSEAFNSQEATYASSDQAYSIFLETTNAERDLTTNYVFNKALFPRVALANRFFKPGAKVTGAGDVDTFLSSSANRATLDIPELLWHKELEPEREANMLETLNTLGEKGVPVPLRMWMAAGKIDETTLLRDLKEDKQLREILAKYTGKDTSHDAADDNSGGTGVFGSLGSLPMSAKRTAGRIGLMQRLESIKPEEPTQVIKGKVMPVRNPHQAIRAQNIDIIKTMRRFEDPHYKETVRKRVQAKLRRK